MSTELKLAGNNNKPADKQSEMPWCHRFMIGLPLMDQQEVRDPMNGKVIGVNVTPKPQMSFVKCLGSACAIWNDEQKKCGDKVQSEALASLAETMSKWYRRPVILDEGSV